MKTRKGILLTGLAVSLLALSGCGSRGMIDAHAFDGNLSPVLDRHDNYVQNDGDLLPVEKETALRSSALLRAVVSEAKQ